MLYLDDQSWDNRHIYGGLFVWFFALLVFLFLQSREVVYSIRFEGMGKDVCLTVCLCYAPSCVTCCFAGNPCSPTGLNRRDS